MAASEQWLSATLEEYKSLRQEALQALAQQQTVLQFGLGVLGVLVGLGVQQAGKEPTLSIVIGTAFVPLVAAFVVVIWVGELERLARVGFHLATIECSVNEAVGRTAIWWESALQRGRGPYRRLRWRYHAVITVLLLVAAIGAVVGNLELENETDWAWAVTAPADLLVIFGVFVWYRYQFRRLGRLGGGARALTEGTFEGLSPAIRAEIERAHREEA